MRANRLLWFLIWLGAGVLPLEARGASGDSGGVEKARTLAHDLLTFEGEATLDSPAVQKLELVVEQAVARVGPLVPGQAEKETAVHFFKAVDEALIQSDVIFPPSGSVDLLKEGLITHSLSEAEFQQARGWFPNRRREPWMRANQRAGGNFYFLDCDLAGVVYLAVAERLRFPVFFVEVPGHNFMRWQTASLLLNWDPNDGLSYENLYYARTWRVTEVGHTVLGYLENKDRSYLLSYWQMLCGRWKVRHGEPEKALVDFRHAAQQCPDNWAVQNELVWLLATSSSERVRNGKEAVALGEKLIVRGRLALWFRSLAAAYSEVGNFEKAVALAVEAKTADQSGIVSKTSLDDLDLCLEAYRQHMSYAAAVRVGAVKAAAVELDRR